LAAFEFRAVLWAAFAPGFFSRAREGGRGGQGGLGLSRVGRLKSMGHRCAFGERGTTTRGRRAGRVGAAQKRTKAFTAFWLDAGKFVILKFSGLDRLRLLLLAFLAEDKISV